jgi:hypothetical protein
MKKKLFIGLSFVFFNININSAQYWEKSYYIWNFGLIARSHKGLSHQPKEYFLKEQIFDESVYDDINTGDIVWVKCRFLNDFCKKVLPSLRKMIVLLIADGDESFPSNCGLGFNSEDVLKNPYIIHIFAQNCDYIMPTDKITRIPIGIDFHTIAYKGNNGGWGEMGDVRTQEEVLIHTLKTLKPTYMRNKRIFVDFQHSDSMRGEFQRYKECGEDRTTIFQTIIKTGLVDYGAPMRRSALWKKKGEYAFSVSPHGNGLDCHRTWEDLALGCIVIVKTSPLDSLYDGLPVVIVKDWQEITPENLEKWLDQYKDAFTNNDYREKLTSHYWISKIEYFSNLCSCFS